MPRMPGTRRPDPDSPAKDQVYVGEGDSVLARLTGHDTDESKDFWTKAVFVISKDQNLTKAHGRYLESRLIEMASSGKHYDVKADPLSLRRLIAWVDTMCPYRGDEEVRDIPDPEFQGVDWLSVRPKIKTAPRIVRPGPVN